MKPQTKNPKSLKSQGIKQSVKFGIKSSGLHHILGILRNQLYSDKVLAVLREYSCNAVDAHAEAGCPERPIVVTLPNRMNPYYKVRDFGPALNESEIQDVYAFYGESTKRNSNNQIGMLGIGSKSAFAYGDNFVINSFIDGEKHIYNAFIDPSQIGQISKIGKESTDEENGIEIVLPTKEEDHNEFSEKAKQLFQWFKVRPIIHGVSTPEYDEHETLFKGDGWRWTNEDTHGYYNKGKPIAVMGNIGYPIDDSALNLSVEDKLDDLLSSNLVLEFEIGDLEIAASREGLQYTEYTRKAIADRLEKVSKELAKEVSKEFSISDTLFDAKCLWGSTFTTTSPLYRLKNVLINNLKWQGKSVLDAAYACWDENVTVHRFKKSYRSERYKSEETGRIECEKGVVIIENDQSHRRGVMSRVLNMIINEDKTPFLIDFKDEKAKKKFITDNSFDAPMVELTSLEKRPLSDFGYANNRGKTTTYGVDSKRNSSKVFTLDWSKDRYERKNSNHFESATVDFDNDEGIFVIIDKFLIQGKDGAEYRYSDSVEPCAMKDLKQNLEKIGIVFPELYAVKTASRGKVEGKDNWTNLWDWITGQVETQIEQGNLSQKFADRVEVNIHLDKWLADEDVTEMIVPEILNEDSLYLKAFESRKEMLHDTYRKKIDAFRTLNEMLGLKIEVDNKPTHDLKKLFREVKEKYEMLTVVDDYSYGYRRDKKDMLKLANYINVIDVCDASRSS
jgi:hypothetical protein